MFQLEIWSIAKTKQQILLKLYIHWIIFFQILQLKFKKYMIVRKESDEQVKNE